ncbi:hypothetical protein A3F03_01645 [Candidatus Roizmanbacteria bacterium RIFCSPHIGHO2_12_FULL_41_11]|uniref:SpoVT-AbrB domain-containing protein n=1 Tax=Candidatus Roizmanbacteria bacterium RIFCSPHIGHO2_12_FULL_41_11 TaxID=1802052 RepID=A0A1F7I309_9BACT|nr:MAG: hypothetical protein A3F03_01645 [Candidatus Roizmanbacteria bacterium RIFCSPHIGHO2_12_FULL_41_11]
MTYTVSITSQGQLSIPVSIRRILDLDKTKKALLSLEKGRVIIEPVKDLLELGGSLKTTKKALSNQQLHEFVEQSATDEFRKKK